MKQGNTAVEDDNELKDLTQSVQNAGIRILQSPSPSPSPIPFSFRSLLNEGDTHFMHMFYEE